MNLLNADGTPSFTSISELRNNFEESFAKKQLGATMKEVVIKSIASIDNKNAENIMTDENVRKLVNNSISDISDKCYTNEELNGSSYLGGLRKLVKEYANMEADYREELANAIDSTEKDKAVAGGKIIELFSTENLSFMNKDIKSRFIDELNSSFSFESDEIITEIGKEVGSAIAEAEEKNVIINETSKVIQDKQDEIREELSSTDEDDEEEETTDNSEEIDDSEDDGTEPTSEDGADGNEKPDEETSTEGFEYGIERLIGLSRDEREEALKFVESKRPQLEKTFETFYEKFDKALSNFENKSEDYHIRRYFDDKKDFKEEISERLDKLITGLHNKKKLFGNSVNKMKFKLCNIRGISNVKYIIALVLAYIPYVGGLASFALILTDEDERKASEVIKAVGDAASSVFETKIFIRRGNNDGQNVSYDLFFQLKVNLKKFWQAGGMEDYDNEVATIEEKLEDSVNNDIENGNITIGEQDITVVSEHIEDGADGNEEPEQTPTDLTVSEPDASNPELEETDASLLTSTEEYRKIKYSNENLGKVIVPLSPTRLDSIDIPSAKALGTIYAKATESLNSLKSVISGRLDLLGDIVEREHDEELTKKFDSYKARAMEAFDDAMDIQGTMNSIGITPFGIENINDPVNVYIGSKAYKYLDKELSLKNKTPKNNFKSVEDAIDAAFDIAIMKDAARNAKDNDSLIAINRDRMSREDLFWTNITNVEADDASIDQIKNVLQFGDLDIDKNALVDTEFLTNIELAIDTIGVKKPGKSESEINKEIFDRTKERIESFLGKDLTYQQIEIIEAMIEGRDTSDYAPTPFEKFVIKLGTDKALEKNGGKDFEIGQESADEIKNKAITLCTLNSFVDKFSPMNENDTKEFKEYIGA